MYVLDEPTTGLHFADVEKLLGVVNGLVDKGNTVIVIEHNLDVIKTADHVIDMGPEGGSGGGLVIAEGTPEEIAANPDSYTGQFLAPILAGRAARTGRAGVAAATVRKPAAKRPAAKAKSVASNRLPRNRLLEVRFPHERRNEQPGAVGDGQRHQHERHRFQRRWHYWQWHAGSGTNGKPRAAVAAQARRRAAKLI